MGLKTIIAAAAAALALTGCTGELLSVVPDQTADQVADQVQEQGSWQLRDPATPAATGAEQLAVECVRKGRKPVEWPGARAYFENNENGTDVVAVEILSRSAPGTVKRIRYQVRNGLIAAESYPNYIPMVDKKRESYAREVAHQANDGRNLDQPVIYEGKYLYKPIAEDGCTMKVLEYDTQRRPLETYIIDVCGK